MNVFYVRLQTVRCCGMRCSNATLRYTCRADQRGSWRLQVRQVFPAARQRMRFNASATAATTTAGVAAAATAASNLINLPRTCASHSKCAMSARRRMLRCVSSAAETMENHVMTAMQMATHYDSISSGRVSSNGSSSSSSSSRVTSEEHGVAPWVCALVTPWSCSSSQLSAPTTRSQEPEGGG